LNSIWQFKLTQHYCISYHIYILTSILWQTISGALPHALLLWEQSSYRSHEVGAWLCAKQCVYIFIFIHHNW